MKHLSLHPTLRTCSADTILRAIEELTCKNITYKSASGKSYDFNTADKMNCLLVNALLRTCSADTILRAIEELTCKNITYKSASGKSYDFNTADKMNCLLVNALPVVQEICTIK